MLICLCCLGRNYSSFWYKIHDQLTWMIAFHAIDYSQTGQLCKYVIIWDWKSCLNRAFQWSLGNVSNSCEGYFGGCSSYDHMLQWFFFLSTFTGEMFSSQNCRKNSWICHNLKFWLYNLKTIKKKEIKLRIEMCNEDTHNFLGLSHAS